MKLIKKITVLLFIVLLVSCTSKNAVKNEVDINALRSIAELSTLECTFHNIAKIRKEKGTGFFHLGEKERKMFIEYKGVVKLGIDFKQLKYDETTRTMLIPKAHIINTIIDSDSYSDVISKDGLFNKNKIPDSEIKNAITESKNNIEKIVAENRVLMRQAQNLAREYVDNYVKKINDGFDRENDIKYVLEEY